MTKTFFKQYSYSEPVSYNALTVVLFFVFVFLKRTKKRQNIVRNGLRI